MEDVKIDQNPPSPLAQPLQNVLPVVNEDNRAVQDWGVLLVRVRQLSIISPSVDATSFELNLVVFKIFQTIGQFSRLPCDYLDRHINNFLLVSGMYKQLGVLNDAFYVWCFLFFLIGSAHDGMFSLDSIST